MSKDIQRISTGFSVEYPLNVFFLFIANELVSLSQPRLRGLISLDFHYIDENKQIENNNLFSRYNGL